MVHHGDRSAPSVSIVLPVYNRATVVDRAILSIIGQTFEDFELIVVDDGSTDETVHIVERHLADQRVRLIHAERNLGAAGARNLGALEARAEWIAFQDSDDRWFPEKLELQVARAASSEGCEAVYCGSIYYSPEHCYYVPRTLPWTSPGDDPTRQLLFGNMLTPQALLIKRSTFLALGGFDSSLSINEDWDFAVRLATATTLEYLPEPLVLIYRTVGSVSSDQKADAEFRARFIERHEAQLRAHPEAYSHQHTIAGRSFMAQGDVRRGRRHFRAALRADRSPSTMARWLRAEVSALRTLTTRRTSSAHRW